MPNGHNDQYNEAWCRERHEKIDTRIDRLDARIWALLILALVQIAGIAGILLNLAMK